MRIRLNRTWVRTLSFVIGILLTAPGFYIGLLGLTDMAPSSPRGFPAIAELLGFGFCAWAVFSSIRLLSERFLNDLFVGISSVIAAAVLGCGFYLLMTVLGLEASFKHKETFTQALQSLGVVALVLLASRPIMSVLQRRK